MKNLILKILIIFAIFLEGCNHCEFIGYDCASFDNSSIRIDSNSYSFQKEKIVTTNITENDSLIFIRYSISQNGNISGSNINIGYGFGIDLEIRKLTDSQFILKSGTVEFIRNNVWGDIYSFDSQNLKLIDYASCKCQKEIGDSIFTPEILLLNIQGVISNGTDKKNIEFDIQYQTKKVENKAC
jgi:hypothetical protein